MNRIIPINGAVLHPSHGGWERFLETECEIRDKADCVICYGSSNCNYIVFPGGELFENYGYNGNVLMDRIRKEGADEVLRDILETRGEIERRLNRLEAALERIKALR